MKVSAVLIKHRTSATSRCSLITRACRLISRVRADFCRSALSASPASSQACRFPRNADLLSRSPAFARLSHEQAMTSAGRSAPSRLRDRADGIPITRTRARTRALSTTTAETSAARADSAKNRPLTWSDPFSVVLSLSLSLSCLSSHFPSLSLVPAGGPTSAGATSRSVTLVGRSAEEKGRAGMQERHRPDDRPALAVPSSLRSFARSE